MAVLNVKGFPDHLYEALRERARRDRRSLAQEVIHLLSESVGSKQRSLLELEGLGREVWKGIDAAQYVAEERATWDE